LVILNARFFSGELIVNVVESSKELALMYEVALFDASASDLAGDFETEAYRFAFGDNTRVVFGYGSAGDGRFHHEYAVDGAVRLLLV
jgi:hypothetical protein